jgi:two-component system sensor histidine kinase YesM
VAVRSNRKFINIVNDIPLSYKFILIYLLCVLIPIISINLFFYNQTSHNIRIREEENIAISMNRAIGEVAGIIEELAGLSFTISNDRGLYEAMDRTYESQVEFYEMNDLLLRNKLRSLMPAHSSLLELGVYTTNDTIESGGEYFYLNKQLQETDWYKEILKADGKMIIFAYVDPQSLYLNRPAKQISIIYKLDLFRDVQTYEKYLKIDLNINKIYETLSREKDYLDLQLIDDRDRVIVTGQQRESVSSLELSPYKAPKEHANIQFERKIGGANYLKGWRLVGTSDQIKIKQTISESRRSIIILMIVSTIIPTVLIFVILRSYHYRIKRLSRHIERVKDERFDPMHLFEGKDEIGGLIRSYNLMTNKINTLINDVYKLEIQKKDLELERIRAELNILQSQMNPHFLFNTLNALLVVSTKNDYTQVTEIIKNLSLMLRRLLSWTDDLVTLKEEITFTEMYLKIEKFRFMDRFDYVTNVDEAVLSYKVPKMSIQPLVENACKHGFQASKGIRNIQITAEATQRYLVVCVSDNGMGMEEHKRLEILQSMQQSNQSGKHVGIRNVYKRLELFYNERVDFFIDSKPGQGTRIGFKIPLDQINKEHV